MEQRLRRQGVATTEQLCRLSPDQLSALWGSKVMGRLWWHRLRGDDLPDRPTRRSSISHSHVLPPELRHEKDAQAILVRLLHKAAARLRADNYWAESLTVSVSFLNAPSWQDRQRFPPCRDTLTLLRALGRMTRSFPRGTPLKVGVVLGHLTNDQNTPPPLYEEDRRQLALSETMDELNKRFGPQALYFAGMHHMESRAPLRIAFTHVPDY
jgi:DNA polymerase-4